MFPFAPFFLSQGTAKDYGNLPPASVIQDDAMAIPFCVTGHSDINSTIKFSHTQLYLDLFFNFKLMYLGPAENGTKAYESKTPESQVSKRSGLKIYKRA